MVGYLEPNHGGDRRVARGVGDLRRFLGIRPEDRRDAAIGFGVLAFVMAAHATLETARDALFLSRLPAEQLPFAYLAIAALAFVAAAVNQRLLARFDKRKLLSLSLCVASTVTAGLWAMLAEPSPAYLYAIYVWTGLVATVVVVQLWLLLGDIVTVSEGKRVFGVVAAGGLIGASLGSLLAERTVAAVGPRHLLAAAAILMLLAAAMPALWRGAALGPEPVVRRAGPDGMRLLRSQPYLRRLLVLVVLSTITLTGVDFVFKTVVSRSFPGEELGEVFARFYLLLNLLGLVLQLVLSGWLVRALGVNRALLALPVLLLAGVAGVLGTAGAALVPVLALKTADGSLRHSLHRTAMEVLYLPLPVEARDRFKALIDGVGQRGGQALASLAILAAVGAGAGPYTLVIAIGVLAGAWMAAVAGIERHYLDLFRGSLRDGTIETRVGLSELDLHSLEALLAALNSDDDAEVLAALDIFAEHDRMHLVPVLLLYHPSREVVLRVLELFAGSGRRDLMTVARRLLGSEDEEIRAAALRAVTAIQPDEALLRKLLQDESPVVHAAALVGLIARRPDDVDELEERLRDHVDNGGAAIRAAVASAIRQLRDPRFAEHLQALACGTEREVQREVVRAMAAIPSERLLPILVQLLAIGSVRSDARAAIVALGPVALAYLDQVLGDTSVPRKVRRHLPRTISRFEPQRAADVLARHLEREPDGMIRFKILRGLGRLRADHPRLKLDREALGRITRQTIGRAVQVLAWRVATEEAHAADPRLETQGGELLVAILREKEGNALERAFRLLGILFPAEDFEQLYHGLSRRGRRAHAGSLELLAHVLEGDLRDAVVAMVDAVPDRERLARARTVLGSRPRDDSSYPERLRAMLDDSSEAIQSVAAYHVAELGMTDLAEELRTARSPSGGFLADVIERALAMLGTPGGPRAV